MARTDGWNRARLCTQVNENVELLGDLFDAHHAPAVFAKYAGAKT
jgi:hypothetical protein